MKTKDDIIKSAAFKLGVTAKQVAPVLEALVATIKEELAGGRSVQIREFGLFEAIEKEERLGRNPKSGDTITIPARTVLKFAASKKLAEQINAGQVAFLDHAAIAASLKGTPK